MSENFGPKPIYEDLSDDNDRVEDSKPGKATNFGLKIVNFSDMVWPAWVYCTRYSDRPSAGPRAKRTRKKEGLKRPRTAFSNEQLASLQVISLRGLQKLPAYKLSAKARIIQYFECSFIKLLFEN